VIGGRRPGEEADMTEWWQWAGALAVGTGGAIVLTVVLALWALEGV
jgi:hypothetical protein